MNQERILERQDQLKASIITLVITVILFSIFSMISLTAQELANDKTALMDARLQAASIRQTDEREYVKEVLTKLSKDGEIAAENSFLANYQEKLEKENNALKKQMDRLQKEV